MNVPSAGPLPERPTTAPDTPPPASGARGKCAEIAEAAKAHRPVTACADCHEPWPCEAYRDAVVASFASLGKTLGDALDSLSKSMPACPECGGKPVTRRPLRSIPPKLHMTCGNGHTWNIETRKAAGHGG